MTRSLLIGLVALALTASVVQAQELAPREVAWANALGEALGERPVAASFTLRHADVVVTTGDGERAPEGRSSGVRVTVGDLLVHRVRFASAGTAHAVAARVDLGTPLVGEVRGDQAVFLVGASLRDPRLARRALDQAWQGLPVSAPASATFAYLDGGDMVVSTSRPGSTLWRSVDSALARAARHPEATTWRGPTDALVATPTGRTLHIRRGADVATLWMANAPERQERVTSYFAHLLGSPPASATPTRRGLADVVDQAPAPVGG